MLSCYWKVEDLPGLSQQQQELLKKKGIFTTQQLLVYGKNSQTKQTLANQLKLNVQYVNKWIALADLSRIPTVGCQYCGLILHSGVASVTQLRQTPPPSTPPANSTPTSRNTATERFMSSR